MVSLGVRPLVVVLVLIFASGCENKRDRGSIVNETLTVLSQTTCEEPQGGLGGACVQLDGLGNIISCREAHNYLDSSIQNFSEQCSNSPAGQAGLQYWIDEACPKENFAAACKVGTIHLDKVTTLVTYQYSIPGTANSVDAAVQQAQAVCATYEEDNLTEEVDQYIVEICQ